MVARTRRFSDLTFRQPCWQADSERSLLVLPVAYQRRFTGARGHRISCTIRSAERSVPSAHGRRSRAPPSHEPAGRRDQPVPAPARPQPGRLVPVGTGGAGACRVARPADLPLDRLRGLPLVPRDGARVVRGRDDRRGAERGVRRDQGGPRGAPRPRPALHGRGAGDDGRRRLADERVPHARGPAVLRRHLLPGHAAPRPAVVPPGARGRARGLDDAADRARAIRRADGRGARGLAGARRSRCRIRRRPLPGRRRPRRRDRGDRRLVRPDRTAAGVARPSSRSR